MATMNSIPATGQTAAAGQSGGQRAGRRMVGLVATATLGLTLVAGTLLGHQRGGPAASAVAPAAPLTRDQLLYDGVRPGLLLLLPGEVSAPAHSAVRPGEGVGLLEYLPGEEPMLGGGSVVCAASGACLVP